MAFTIQLQDERKGRTGLKDGDVPYQVFSDAEETDGAARDYLFANAPSIANGLYKRDADVTPVAAGLWEGTVNYSTPERADPTAAMTKIRFRFAEGKQRIYHKGKAYTRVGVYGTWSGIPGDIFGGMIGVDEHGVPQGADVPASTFDFSLVKYLPAESVTKALLQKFYSMQGWTNSAAFAITDDDGIELEFGINKCIFHGAVNGDAITRTDGSTVTKLIPITYEFSGGMIETDVSIGDIVVPQINPFDLVWTQSERSTGTASGKTFWTLKPKYAVVDRPRSGPFSDLGLGIPTPPEEP